MQMDHDDIELSRNEEILRQNAAVIEQMSNSFEPTLHKSSAPLKNIKKAQNPLKIETDEIKVPCVRDLDMPCGCDNCIGGDPEEV
jgi:hypothetical protein